MAAAKHKRVVRKGAVVYIDGRAYQAGEVVSVNAAEAKALGDLVVTPAK